MFIAIQVPGHQAYYEKQAISRAPKALRILLIVVCEREKVAFIVTVQLAERQIHTKNYLIV